MGFKINKKDVPLVVGLIEDAREETENRIRKLRGDFLFQWEREEFSLSHLYLVRYKKMMLAVSKNRPLGRLLSSILCDVVGTEVARVGAGIKKASPARLRRLTTLKTALEA